MFSKLSTSFRIPAALPPRFSFHFLSRHLNLQSTLLSTTQHPSIPFVYCWLRQTQIPVLDLSILQISASSAQTLTHSSCNIAKSLHARTSTIQSRTCHRFSHSKTLDYLQFAAPPH